MPTKKNLKIDKIVIETENKLKAVVSLSDKQSSLSPSDRQFYEILLKIQPHLQNIDKMFNRWKELANYKK